jgi:hypothetical protein
MAPRGVCLPDMSAEDTTETLMISDILWRLFTFIRVIPLECVVNDVRSHVSLYPL